MISAVASFFSSYTGENGAKSAQIIRQEALQMVNKE
jgi:hypothetical protein